MGDQLDQQHADGEHRCIHQVFEQVASSRPEHTAVVCGDERWSYTKLNQEANRMARLLIREGLGQEEPVAIALPRSCAYIAAMLAVLKAGGAYVPIVENQPIPRLRSMIYDSRARLLIGDADHLPELHRDVDRVITFEDAANEPDTNLKRTCAPSDLAYVMYTSGSTGEPKGVMIEHDGVLRLALDQWFLPVGPGVNYLCVSSFGFDASTIEIYAALLHGSTLAMTTRRVPEPDEVRELITREYVRAAWIAFGFFSALFEADPAMFEPVECVMTGGEPVHAELIRRAQRALPNTRFVNCYGPTECTALSTAYEVPKLDDVASGVLPIGRALRGMDCTVVGEDGEVVSAGSQGELHISGVGITRGYLNAQELTQSKVITDTHGSRTFRSGDLVRENSEGELEFLSRIDAQVKLRGNRFELGDVESIAVEHDQVSSCVACIVGSHPAEELVLVVSHAQGELDADQIRKHIGEKLPEYMVPTEILSVDEIPLTRNGKADREAVAKLAQSMTTTTQVETTGEFGNHTQAELATLMQDVLGTTVVSGSDQFLHLGGHSLRAVVLCARIRTHFGVRVAVSSIYQHPTVAQLGQHIDRLLTVTEAEQASPILASGQNRSPLSLNQLRLWMLDQLNPGDPGYTITIRLSHEGKLNKESFEAAWAYMCSRHQILASRVCTNGTEPELLLNAQESMDCVWVTYEDLNDSKVAEIAERESSRGFDLESGPLTRCMILESPAESTVLISMHHIISDAWSCEILQRELREAYIAFESGFTPDHPPLQINYADYAHWERSLPQLDSYQRDLHVWRDSLLDATVLRLPKDRVPTSSSSNKGIRVELPISNGLLGEVHNVALELGVTPFAYMLSIFKVWLHRLTREQDIVVGVPVANRAVAETQGLVGFFMETLPLRDQVSHGDTLRDLIKGIAENTLEAFDRRDVAFQHIVESLGLHAETGQNPLFEIFFNHIAIPLSSMSDESRVLSMNEDEVDNQTAKFDLTCYIFEESAKPRIEFNARRSLFTEQTLRWYISQYAELLRQSIRHLDTQVSQIPMEIVPISSPEPALVPGPSLPIETSMHGSIPDLIEEAVSSNRGRIAVQTQSDSITYQSLWARSNLVASQLTRAELPKNARVLIAVENPIDVCVAVLGVLRAGHTFVPTDAHWPASRLQQIIEYTAPSAIVGPVESLPVDSSCVQVSLDPSDTGTELIELPAIPADSPAYVMFTSGSTGTPKGVVQSNSAVVGHMQTFAHSMKLMPGERLLQLSSFAFDASIMDMFACWFTGSTLCVSDPRIDDADSVHAFIKREQIDIIHAAPTTFRWLTGDQPEGEENATVRCVVLGGEHCLDVDIDAIQTHFPSCALLINGLGLTESSLNLQYRVDPRLPMNWPSRIPIGFPVEGVRARLLDRDGRPTLPTGEIEIESDRIAMGYLQSDGSTNTQGSSDLRAWRTGDIATIRHDGSMMHLGREDDQVQIRGCRVELGEVQAVLQSLADVQDSAVLIHYLPQGIVQLHAYVVCDDDINQSTLTAEMSSSVPSYMIPERWVRVRVIPRVGGGKHDRAKLLRTKRVEFAQHPNDDARPPSEQALVIMRAFQSILGVDVVEQDDNFFHLGGNSLRAIQLFNHLRKHIGSELPISVIYRSPTPRQLDNEFIAIAQEIDAYEALINLQGSEKDHTVIVLPGIGGHPLGFGPLIDRVSSRVNFIGVQYPGEDVLNEIGRTLPDLASWIIDQLNLEESTRVPDLIGYSFGGSLAMEIAMQLRQRGFKAGRIMLLDAHLPFGLPQKSKFGKAKVHLARIVEGHETSRLGYIRGKLKARAAQPTQEQNQPHHPELATYRAISRINRQMVIEYRTSSSYDADVTLVRARQPDWLRFHHDDGYNGFCKLIDPDKIHSVEIDAAHLELFDPGPASKIAKIVDDWLDQPLP